MTGYRVGDVTTKVPYPESPTFATASEAALWAVRRDLSPTWWTVDADPQPARMEGVQ